MDLTMEAAAPFPAESRPRTTPWEDPELSRVQGFYRTVGELLFRPAEFFEHLGSEGRAEPLAFGLIAGSTGLMGAIFWQILLGAALAPATTQAFGSKAAGVLLLMALAPALTLAKLLVASFCLWVAASLLGVGRGFTPAWRICGYVQGGMLLALIPLFGGPLAAGWTLLLIYRGAATVFETGVPATLAIMAVFLILAALIWLVLVGSSLALMALGGLLLLLGGG